MNTNKTQNINQNSTTQKEKTGNKKYKKVTTGKESNSSKGAKQKTM